MPQCRNENTEEDPSTSILVLWHPLSVKAAHRCVTFRDTLTFFFFFCHVVQSGKVVNRCIIESCFWQYAPLPKAVCFTGVELWLLWHLFTQSLHTMHSCVRHSHPRNPLCTAAWLICTSSLRASGQDGYSSRQHTFWDWGVNKHCGERIPPI